MAKKYVSLSKLSTFLGNLKNTFALKTHKHTVTDITDIADIMDVAIDTELSATSNNPVANSTLNAEFDAISDAMGALEAAIDDKADASHTHDDRYYTESEIDTKLSNKADSSHTHSDYVSTSRTVNGKALSSNVTLSASDVGADASGSANTALTSAKSYTDEKIEALGDTYYTETEIDTKLSDKANSTHNHDTSYDAKGSAANALTEAKTYTDTVASGKANTSHTHSIENITNLQTTLDGKASSSHTHNAAGSSLGFVKSGGDVTISDGVITVNDDSHNHIISNVDGLQNALDGKLNTAVAIPANADLNNYTTNGLYSAFQIVTAQNLANNPLSSENTGIVVEVITEGSSVFQIVYGTLDGAICKRRYSGDKAEWSDWISLVTQTDLNVVDDKLDAHTGNSDVHVTTSNKSNWNAAYTHSQSTHARTDATNVADSTTNGNILINGSETNVYTHPNSGVTAGTYKSVTVNAQGHITAGTNPTTLAGYGITDAESKGAASSALASAKEYTDSVASGKSNTNHNHDSAYDAKGSASNALASAKSYADSAATTAANAVKNDLLNGAGSAYDTLQELGDLIDDNADAIDALETVAANKADKTHSHAIADVSGLQSALDGKAASSHGTHVSYSTTAPVMDGTASVGTASTVARSDHKHPTDTSRASKTEFDSHTANTTAHITSTERSNWNAAKTHADSAHAPSNAQPNQNAFSNITVGSTTVSADSPTDTVTFVGSNVTITPDATNDKITFSVTDGSTSTKGLVQLTDSTSSTSTTTAATPNSVKSAYDLANTAKTAATNAQAAADAKVPTSRTVNGKALTGNITLSASDVGAAASSHTHENLIGNANTNAPFKTQTNLFYVNRQLAWNTNSYLQHVILLLPVLTSNNWCGQNFIDGKFLLWKTGGNIYNTVEIGANCVYNTLEYQLRHAGLGSDDGTQWKLCVCKYNGVWYYAIRCPYRANPYLYVEFNGHIKSELTGGTGTVALPLDVAYYDTNSKSILNEEVYNSITDTLKTTYVTTVTTRSLNSEGGFRGDLVGNATSATKATQDASGNTITSTYATKSELNTAKTNLQTAVDGKLPLSGGTMTGGINFSGVNNSLSFNGASGYSTDTYGNFVAGSSAATWNIMDSNGATKFSVGWATGDTNIRGSLTVAGTINGNATSATKATQDASGNTITSTYATKTELNTAKTSLQSSIDGKAASSHNHAASNITSGTLSSDRLPTVPISKGGTGATDAASARSNLGITLANLGAAASSHTHSISNITNLQSSLDGKLPLSGGSLTGALSVNRTAAAKDSPMQQDIVINYSLPSGGTLTEKNAPGIGFHIGNVNWANFIYDGKFKFMSNDFTSYASVQASSFTGALKGNADTATKATQDGSGNVITSTYATKTELNGKANSSHTHDDRYYTESEIDSKVSTLNTAINGKAASSHTHNYLTLKGTNTISSKTNDTVANWGAQNTGVHFYSQTDYLTDQPSQWGYLLNVSNGTSEVHQIWMEQASGELHHRGGNSSGWSGSWRTLIDSANIGSQSVNYATSAGSATSATKATQDGNGNNIVNTYATKSSVPTKTSQLTNDSGFKTTDNNTTYSLSKSGSTITLTGSDGSTTSVTDADTNTTYSVASTTANGLMSSTDKCAVNTLTPVTTSGSGSAYTASVSGIGSLTVGTRITIVPHIASASTTATLNLNSLGAKQIRRRLSSLATSVQAGYTATWLAKGKPYTLIYDGSYWIVEGLTKPAVDDLYGTVPVSQGGTGATTAAAALTNLGITYGTSDLVAGSSSLTSGTFYFVYE